MGRQPKPYISPPPPSAGGRSRLLIVGAAVAVLAIAGAGLYIATKDDDEPFASETTESVATALPTSTMPAAETTTTITEVATTQPPTTAAPTTVASTTTVPGEATTTTVGSIPAIPPGSADLGNGVALPIPAGFVPNNAPGSMVTLTDETSVIVAHSAVRAPGTDPAVITQEYVSAFDPTFATISYGPTAKSRTIAGDRPTDVYTTFFLTFDEGSGASQSGFLDTYVRADGLMLVISVYGPNGHSGLIPSADLAALDSSFQATPAVAAPTPLVEVAPFRVATIHPVVPVHGLVAFTATPSFSVIDAGPGRGFVTNTVEDVQVARLNEQADTAVVTSSAQAIIAEHYGGIEYSELLLDGPDPYGVVHGTFEWTGVYSDGQRSRGKVDFYYDPASGNAYVMLRTWFGGSDVAEPAAPATNFMLRTLFNSFTTIP